ncbi:hypothetical protein BB561_001232 [Smittium simulii]|uniref:Pentacotripeptide-repeat region of PRORP domain-containing protein n=1 Tax=Smittium simulii TaxID=133385 RepID=A0A2T9YVI4_9FUNG|nr:hypothetical protein BB561_001232 [Smittium simulii]
MLKNLINPQIIKSYPINSLSNLPNFNHITTLKTISIYPEFRYSNKRLLSNTSYQLDFRSQINNLVNKILKPSDEQPLNTSNSQADKRSNDDADQSFSFNPLKNIWRYNRKRNTRNYVGLMVALDAKHAEKSWGNFFFDPEASISNITVSSKNKHIWYTFLKDPKTLANLSSDQLCELKNIIIEREHVIFNILDVFLGQINMENRIKINENKLTNSLDLTKHLTEKYWGYRIVNVLNHLFFVREWCELVEIYNYQITEGCSGNSYNLDFYLSRENALNNQNSEIKTDYNNNLFDFKKAMEISAINQSPCQVYLKTLKLMLQTFELSTYRFNRMLSLCVASNDLNSTIDSLNSFTDIPTSEFSKLSNENNICIQVPKDVSYSIISKFADGYASDMNYILMPNINNIKPHSKNTLSKSMIKPDPLSFVLLGKIVNDYDSNIFIKKKDGAEIDTLNQIKSTVMKNIYSLFNQSEISYENFKTNSKDLISVFDFLQTPKVQLLSSQNGYIVPIFSITSQLLESFLKSGNVMESLNTYESFKILSKNLILKTESAVVGLKEFNKSQINEIYKSINISFFNLCIELAFKFELDWFSKLIILDLNQFDLAPSADIIDYYIRSLACGKNNLALSEIENSIKEVYEFYVADISQVASEDLLANILDSISKLKINKNTVCVNGKITQESYESIGYNLYTAYSKNNVNSSTHSKKILISLLNCLCNNGNLCWIDKAQDFVNANLQYNDQVYQRLVYKLMESYTAISYPNKALELFESILKQNSSDTSNYGIEIDLYASAMKAYYVAKDYAQVIDIAQVLIQGEKVEYVPRKSNNKNQIGNKTFENSLLDDILLKDLPEYVFDILTDSYMKMDMLEEALKLLENIRAERIQTSSFMYASMIRGFGKNKNPQGMYLVSALANLDRNLSARNVDFTKIMLDSDNSSTNTQQVVNLDSDYHTALIESCAELYLTTEAFQSWELMQINNIKPSSKTAKVMIDICGWTGFKAFSSQPTLMEHDTYTFSCVSEERSNDSGNGEPSTGKIIYLYKLGSVLKSLEEGGYKLSKSDVKSVFEVLCRARLYDDAVEYLISNDVYKDETQKIKHDGIENTDKNTIVFFASNLLKLIGDSATEALKKLEQ